MYSSRGCVLASVPKESEVPLPRLQNVVSTFSMGTSNIDLSRLVMTVPFLEFNARRFAAAVMKLKDPRTTCLVFASGKGVCTGAKTERLSQLAAVKFVTLLQRCGADVRFQNFSVQNIVAAAHCPFNLDLRLLANCVSGMCSYEPNLFPGLMYRIKVQNNTNRPNTIVFLCFQSGRCVITGGKNRQQILSAWNDFYNKILRTYAAGVGSAVSDVSSLCAHPPLSEEKEWFLQKLMHTYNPSGGQTDDGCFDWEHDWCTGDSYDTALEETLTNEMKMHNLFIKTIHNANPFVEEADGSVKFFPIECRKAGLQS